MMKVLLSTVVALGLVTLSLHARLGENNEECEARYGKGRELPLELAAGLEVPENSEWTAKSYSARGLSIQVVFDNEVLLSVGVGFTTATAEGSDLAGIAAAAGVPRTARCHTVDAFQDTFREALAARELTTLVAKVEPKLPPSFFIDCHMLENRFEFQRYLTRDS